MLLDNSAIRVFALRDPDASVTNRLLRREGATSVLTMFTISEVFKGFVNQPENEELHRELQARSAFILSLERLLILPDTVHCAWLEYFHGRGVDRLSSEHPQVKGAKESLSSCAKGELPEEAVASGRKYYAADKAHYQEGLAIALAHDSHVHLQSEPVSIVRDPTFMAHVTEILLTNEAARRRAKIDPSFLNRACHFAARSPYRVPYLVGASRVQMWFHWKVANSPSKNVKAAFREDLKLLPFALYAGAVLSRDGDYRRFGPEMFPEVRFLNPDDFLRQA